MNTPVPPTEAIEFAEEELSGKILQVLVKQLENQRAPWNTLTEDEQAGALQRMTFIIDEAIARAVHVIAGGNRAYIRANVESVTFKDGVKASISLPKGDGAHDLADAEGSTVLIVIVDEANFTQGTNKIEPAAEQRSLALAGAREELKIPQEETSLPARTEAAPVPEVHKLKDGVFEIVIGKDKLHYPGSPESFTSAIRAEDWLQKHLAQQSGELLAQAVGTFRAEGKAEGEKPDDERNYDAGFERAAARFSKELVEENYAELSAAFVDGWDEGIGDG